MKKFLKNTSGAVTVFITILLIPAMLVSGTAVDLARIHTAQSTLQNANQLAANTVLTQYNALLYDIYGLMGIAQDDPILWDLLDQYIKVTIFGEQGTDRTLGTLQPFYGANIHMEEIYFPAGKNLSNEDILRRQIEEYMKFRGPILLVEEFIERITDNRIVEDAALIKNKVEIDAAIVDIYEKYKALYDAIVAADRCTQAIGGIAGGSFGNMSSILTSIYDEFQALALLNTQYHNSECPVERAFIAQIYNGTIGNVRSWVEGGQRRAFRANEGWVVIGNINVGLTQAIQNAMTQADNFKPRFDLVVSLARQIDEMKVELKQKLDTFEQKLSSGEISEELRIAFTQEQGSPPKSILQRYRDIIRWNIEPMAIVFRDGGYSYIDDIHKPMLEEVRYRNRLNEFGSGLSIGELANVRNDSRFSIHNGSAAERFVSFPRDNVTYRMLPGFLRFAEHGGDNEAFFAELYTMMNQPTLPPVKLFDGQEDAGGADAEQQQRNLINELLTLANTAYNGLKNEPLGAMYIGDAAAPESESVNILEIAALIPQALTLPVLNVIRDPLGTLSNVADYVLLLTYSTFMFSNYSTSKPETIGMTRANLQRNVLESTISGVPMCPHVNYFYQSELEYLYNGSEHAATNLSAITRLLLLVRLVCNYIRVFSVSEINTVIGSIKASFAWSPPLALILGELARAAFVAAESVIDVAALRTGHRVTLFKNIAAGEWIATPSGVLRAASRVISNESVDGNVFANNRGHTYLNYMQFFFLTRALFYTGSDGDAGTQLARRVGNLIEWNIVNFKSGSKADESLMAAALNQPGRFRLAEMKTDFNITTTADLRMMFLSMAFAQNFSDSRGIGMPQAMAIRATVYRGY
ncbi:MAG: DUF5702 domain-containing protein [Oscillospiraceae bacterium]|nr:DUF5702 domain-containing protein [Oscillospiraceae bacterium]